MLTVLWIVIAILLAALLTSWIAFTATRLDRLHARVDAAQAALDAQLVRRAAAVQHIADATDGALPAERRHRLGVSATSAMNAAPADRELAENAVGRAVHELAGEADSLPPEVKPSLDELADTAVRVVIARRFFNDAVRDTRTLRGRRMPRLLHLAGHRELPQYFDIDDTSPFDDTRTVPALDRSAGGTT